MSLPLPPVSDGMAQREVAGIVESAMEEPPDTTVAVETEFSEAKHQGDEALIDSAHVACLCS